MRKILIILTALPLLLAGNLPSGREIMEKVTSKATWKDMVAEVELIISARGRTRIRKIKMFSRKRTANENDTLMKFVYPPDVEGTAFLLKEHSKGEDERYLYLPALRRIRRIAASGKGGAFMGSDFSYYDIGKPKLEDWNYKNLGLVELNGKKVYKIEATPVSKKVEKETKYSKIIHYVDPEKWSVVRAEYYDRTGALWKVLEVKEFQKIKGSWFQTDMVMKNVQSKSQSEMKFLNLKIDQGLPASLFTKRSLAR